MLIIALQHNFSTFIAIFSLYGRKSLTQSLLEKNGRCDSLRFRNNILFKIL